MKWSFNDCFVSASREKNSDVLHQVPVPLVPKEKCDALLSKSLHQSLLCAGGNEASVAQNPDPTGMDGQWNAIMIKDNKLGALIPDEK